jgi:hypothetical protein
MTKRAAKKADNAASARQYPEYPKYRCKKCDSFIPRGHRMQSCECGQVYVDWGNGGISPWTRVLWPGGDPDDWIIVYKGQE